MRNGIRVTCAMPEGNARGMKGCGREKSAARGINCRGDGFAWAQEAQQNMGFCDGTALAQEPARVYAPLMQRPKSEFCHVACPWRCVVGDRRPQGADVVKAAVARQPGCDESVRFF